MTDPAYPIFWDTSHVGDEGVTASLVGFPGSDDILGWKDNEPLPVPARIYFEANVETARRLDYLDNDARWPIMSARMRAIVLDAAPAHRVIPVTLLDDTVPTAQRLDAAGEPRPGVALEGFAAVQLLEHADVMDLARSKYSVDEDAPESITGIQTLVFKDVPLPSLFRLSAYTGPLLVSRTTREAMEQAGLTGIQYWPLRRIRST